MHNQKCLQRIKIGPGMLNNAKTLQIKQKWTL